jgi:hypothetical protein
MTNSTTFPGTVTATSYEGSGANLTGISAGFDPDVDIIDLGNGAGGAPRVGGNESIAIGHDAASAGNQGQASIAIGPRTAKTAQGSYSVAIGRNCASADQGASSVAIGNGAAMISQGNDCVAIGRDAGSGSQLNKGVAIGYSAGMYNQGSSGNPSIAIGYQAGLSNQQYYGIAIGQQAARNGQGYDSIAIGESAGYTTQGTRSITIGKSSGGNQGYNCTAIGYQSQYNSSTIANDATSLGHRAGLYNQHNNTLVLNGYGDSFNSNNTYRFFVKPVRNQGALSYSSSSGEIYGNSSDDRVKHNESYIKNALKTIMKLKPQTYDKCSSLESNTYVEMHESGFMAQDIWYDVPEMKHIVVLAPTANPTPEKPPAPSDDPRDDPDYSAWGADLSTLNYTQVIPFLTKAVQEVAVEVPRAKTTVSNTWGQNITGLVVSANTNKHKTNTIPMVNLSTVSMDKSWYGIVSSEKTDSIDYDTLVDIKGDSRLWVTDTNGPLESGDLITTSNVATGYAQKQGDDIVRNYTIGKITQDCDFTEPSTITLKVPKQELSNVTYYIYQQEFQISLKEYNNIGVERKKTTKVDTIYRIIDKYDDDSELGISQGAYDKLNEREKGECVPRESINYYRLDRYESKYQNDAYKNKHTIEEIRQELIDVLDENGQTVWEETGETQPVYTLVNHGTYKAAFVTCKLI